MFQVGHLNHLTDLTSSGADFHRSASIGFDRLLPRFEPIEEDWATASAAISPAQGSFAG
jgi:hypothetical protein